jgi:hypothetical protein
MVDSAKDLANPQPSLFTSFFQQLFFCLEKVWSAVHGSDAAQHLDDVGRFYANAVGFLCPMLGFLMYLVIFHPKVGLKLLTPVAIALSQMTPLAGGLDYPMRALGLDDPSVYVVIRTLVVLMIMIWASGAFRTKATGRKQTQVDPWPGVQAIDGM